MLHAAGQLQDALKQNTEAEAALTALKAANTDLSNRQPRLERRVQLLTKEVDSLKQVLKMYEDEAPGAAAPKGQLNHNQQDRHLYSSLCMAALHVP